MKNELKISTLSIICVLCTAGISAAYAAPSVRSLGGTGTYSSASSATESASKNTSTSSNGAAVRGGSVRVTPSAGKTGSTAKPSSGTTSYGRVATTPRLSMGGYLGGGASVSGGSSIRPQRPGNGGSSSGGGGSMDPDAAAELQRAVDQLQRDVEGLVDADNTFQDALDEKQGILSANDGFVVIDDTTNEIFVDVDNLKDAIGAIAGQDGREVEIGSNTTDLLWRYAGDADWQILISKTEITGPQGPQGEKGEPGDVADVDLSEYAKTEDVNTALALYSNTTQMNQAISDAIALSVANLATKTELDAKADKTALDNLATKTELAGKADKTALDGLATKTELAGKANASDVYTKTEVYTKGEVDTKVADVVAGDMGEALKAYAKTEDVNTALAGKVDTATLADYATKTDLGAKADKTTVDALDTQLQGVASTATGAASAASAALSDAGEAKTTAASAKTAAETAQTTATTAKTTADAAKTAADAATTAAGNAATLAETAKTTADTAKTIADAAKTAADNATTAVAGKADKATTLAGYGITDAYTKGEVDTTVSGLATKAELDAKANAADVYTSAQTNNLLDAKQDKLTFDDKPTADSTNPVTSSGIAKAIADAQLAGEVDLTGYATTEYVNNLVPTTAPSTDGDYMLTVNNGQKEWVQVKIVTPENTGTN